MKFLRTVLYAILVLVLINLIFWGFSLLVEQMIIGLAYFESKLNFFVFWLLFFLIGGTVLSIFWYSFKLLAVLAIGQIARLRPYKGFATWTVTILSFTNGLFTVIGFWRENGFPNTVIGITGVVISLMAFSLCISLTNMTERVISSQEEFNNLFDDIETLDEAEVLDTTMSREDAHEFATKIRALKSTNTTGEGLTEAEKQRKAELLASLKDRGMLDND